MSLACTVDKFVIYRARTYDLWPSRWFLGYVTVEPGETGRSTYPIGPGCYPTHAAAVAAMNDELDHHYGRGRWNFGAAA